MSLTEQIQQDLVAAMRGRDALRLGTLRMIKTAFENKRVEKRAPLSDDEARAVLSTLLKQRRESAEAFRAGGRSELADREEAEVGIIEAYLPAAAAEEEIAQAIDEAIAETGAAGPPDMGRVMKATMARLASKTVDGRQVSALVTARLRGG